MLQSTIGAEVSVDRSLADDVRESLIPRTLRHASLVSPFYAKRLTGMDLDFAPALPGLVRIPLLTKSDLTENYDSICMPLDSPQFIMYTSGTDGHEMLVPVSPEEIAAGETHFADVWPSDRQRPLTMSLVRVGHGGQWFSSKVPTIPAHTTYGPDQVISLLRRRFKFPGVEDRITILEGNLLTLRALTAKLIAQNIRGQDFGLQLVLTTGWYVTARARAELEEFWGARLLDRYGVTEVNGDAKQCPQCGKFHFDPIVVAETVKPRSKQPVYDGIGLIVLTGLWPFNQVAPKIRYEIGDVVQVSSNPGCGLSEPAYEFLGRQNQSVFVEQGSEVRYLLFPTEVADVLDEYAEVVRRQHTGFLNFRSTLDLSTKKPCLRLEVEWSGPSTGKSDEISSALINRSAYLRSAMADGICELEVVFQEPNFLSHIHKV